MIKITPPHLQKVIDLLRIKIRERIFQKKLPYLFFDNHSDSIIIVFSAFTGDKRRYNYVKGLKHLKIDKLYILDPFGFRGSYNMFENGSNYPELLTKQLIDSMLKKKQYRHIYTMGSSKGGSCAIYFGLPLNVDAIFAGACQFNIGTYVSQPGREKILKGMMGENADKKDIEKLNRAIPSVMEVAVGTKTKLHILYSKRELTYERQIIDLLAKARECGIPFLEIEEQFENHEDVGYPFLSYVTRTLQKIHSK